MAKKLWLVNLNFDMVILCDDKEDIRYIIEEHAGDELDNDISYNNGVYINPITDISMVPQEWKNAIPWSECDQDPELTVRQILKKKTDKGKPSKGKR